MTGSDILVAEECRAHTTDDNVDSDTQRDQKTCLMKINEHQSRTICGCHETYSDRTHPSRGRDGRSTSHDKHGRNNDVRRKTEEHEHKMG